MMHIEVGAIYKLTSEVRMGDYEMVKSVRVLKKRNKRVFDVYKYDAFAQLYSLRGDRRELYYVHRDNDAGEMFIYGCKVNLERVEE